ncbi:stage III sporulation protein AE [Clostridium amylolyticum]|uniref:Stage III sporulation protein AE n=1 Tax=Clostridium amylolyticum TaxID=1121298 RepID=A0A1M6KHQ6_9CLOT|nr:stage III sporulation protein AE [Clostridium amylolyticum]SHJ58486.1 stage III sporulation protein AE [Clostridium amylolyticum]
MKKLIVLVLLILLLPMGIGVRAEESEIQETEVQETVEVEKMDDLYNYINNIKLQEELLNSLNIKDYLDFYLKNGQGNLSVKKIIATVSSIMIRELISFVKLSILIIILALIAALLKNVQNAFSNDSLSNIAYFACYALLIIILSKSFIISVEIAKSTIEKISNFMMALIPVLITLLATVGGIAQAAAMDPVIIIAVNLCPKIYMDIIIPLILMGFMLQFANNISEGFKLDGLSKLIKQSVIWIQGIMITIFIAVVTIRGVTSSTIDAVTLKTAKFAVDNFIPIVGKAMSDAISSVAGYSLILKSATGTLGLIVIIFIVLVPILKLFLCALVYKLTAAFIEPISDSRIVRCIASAGDSLILIMSCVISVSVMFFIMISIMSSAGKFVISG